MFKEARRLDINFEGDLNPDQLAAVTSPPNRPALVLAGAGSGKTRTLTYRVAWLISECGLDPSDILLLTFTNKAANQMLARIEDLTGCESWRFWGGTFHSVGNKFLRIEGEKIGLDPNFSIIDSEDSDKLIKETVDEKFPRFFSDKENPRPKLLREIISYARNTCASYSSITSRILSFSFLLKLLPFIPSINIIVLIIPIFLSYLDKSSFFAFLEQWKIIIIDYTFSFSVNGRVSRKINLNSDSFFRIRVLCNPIDCDFHPLRLSPVNRTVFVIALNLSTVLSPYFSLNSSIDKLVVKINNFPFFSASSVSSAKASLFSPYLTLKFSVPISST